MTRRTDQRIYSQPKTVLAEKDAEIARLASELQEARAQAAHDREVLASYHGSYTTQRERAERAEAELQEARDKAEALWAAEHATVMRVLHDRDRLRAALQSIAANTCCDRCHEAALVAQAALER